MRLEGFEAPVRLSDEEFEQLVVDALDSLPEQFLTLLNNIDVVIEREPSRAQLSRVGIVRGTLLGLYEGVPLTQRNSGYNIVAPDKITIFQGPIERKCHSPAAVADQVRKTVVHEIAHHFGIGEQRLAELGWA